MMTCPQSRLTMERPDIWGRALVLATNLTGYTYPAKMPSADGTTISACGGGYAYEPPADEIKRRQRRIDELEKEINERDPDEHPSHKKWKETVIEENRERIEEIKRKNPEGFATAGRVFVPEGAMEWLLHEVGHWVAATEEERLLPDYGYGRAKEKGWGRAREWQAWGFEDIIFSPFGVSRLMAAPEHRGGTAFSIGPMPQFATAHADKQIQRLGIVTGEWRALYGEWLAWERSRNCSRGEW